MNPYSDNLYSRLRMGALLDTSSIDPLAVADTLDGAAKLIDTGGLTKRTLNNGYGEHCAVGAIMAVADDNPALSHAARRALADELLPANAGLIETGLRAAPSNDGIIFRWNDFRLRTQRGVVRRLRAAAKTVRERNQPDPTPAPTRVDHELAGGPPA